MITDKEMYQATESLKTRKLLFGFIPYYVCEHEWYRSSTHFESGWYVCLKCREDKIVSKRVDEILREKDNK